MSREFAALAVGSSSAPPVSGVVVSATGHGPSSIASSSAADVASVLRDKDSIIRAQAKRIIQLEREAEVVRKDRDSLATKVALLTYKLEMYSKDLYHHHNQQGRQPQNMNAADSNQSRGCRSSDSSSSSSHGATRTHTSQSASSRQAAAPSQFKEVHCASRTRPFSPQPKTSNISSISRASPSDKLQQRPIRLQKRTSDEDEKIKRSRDWDYELSQDLQAKQIEMLEKKYGGSLRAGRAARVIQQAYRQYCLNKNFAKLRLEADTKRLSRRFTDFGRTKTLWTDMVSTVEYGGHTPPIQRSIDSSTVSFGIPAYENVNQGGVRPDDAICSRMISHNSAAFSSYYCRVLQKTLSASASERSVVRECPPPPVRYARDVTDLGAIHETHDFADVDKATSQKVSQASSGGASVKNHSGDLDVFDWPVEKSGGPGGSGFNGNDDDLGMSSGSTPSYVDHNVIDNNLDFDVEGNASECFNDMPLAESPYCDHRCVPLNAPVPVSQVEQHPGYYEGIRVCRVTASMAPPPVPTSSPSGYVYSSLRLCTLKHGTSSASALENLSSKQPSGSPIWKRKNCEGGFAYGYEGDVREPGDRGGCGAPHAGSSHTSTGGSASHSGAIMATGGVVIPSSAYLHGMQTTCSDCAQLLQMSHHYHHQHHHHHHHHHHASQQQQSKVSDKQRKRIYRIGLNLFNKKPEKGIRYLIERRFLDNRPNAVARFLISRKGLSKQMIGEYLGNLQKQFNMEVLRCFAEEIDLIGLEIDVALRKFQSYFRMPGEAQKIERLMEAFASQYCQCNPHVARTFRRADTVFLLAFATIMLNTDLHNKSIKPERKMKLQDFIRNLRGIDDGEDIDPNLLTGIYERIKIGEFQPGSDHVTQVAKVEQSIVGKRPQLTALHRRLVCYCRLYEVQDLNRREKLGQHQREVFLFNDLLMVTKILGKKKNCSSYTFRSSFSLSGMIVYLFDTPHYKYGIRLMCSSTKKDYVMLYARNEHDRSKFVDDLKEAILEMNEMEALRIEEELQKQKIQQKHCNFNRHSKDSGVVDIELLRPSDFAVNRHSTADCVSIGRTQISGSLVDMTECGHRGSAGSLDSGLVSIHAPCDHIVG